MPCTLINWRWHISVESCLTDFKVLLLSLNSFSFLVLQQKYKTLCNFRLMVLSLVFWTNGGFFFISQSSVEESRTLAVEVGTSELPDEDHRTAADNPGVVMNEIEPSVSERRPSSDGSGRNRDRYFAD